MKKTIVTRSAFWFCDKCGYNEDRPTQMEKSENSYTHITTDATICPECNKQSFYPLALFNSMRAIRYLLKALH